MSYASVVSPSGHVVSSPKVAAARTLVACRHKSRSYSLSAFRSRFYSDFRSSYRIFNSVEYRFYRSNSGPPSEDDTPFAVASSLPSEPSDTYADGTWYLSMSYFNGVIDSGFKPIGPRGETYLRLDIAGGEEDESPPAAPISVSLIKRPGGVIRVNAVYYESGSLRADSWGIAYTTNGSTPSEDSPSITQVMPTIGLAVLSYDLPAQLNGTTVKVRVQTSRGSVYSEGSSVLSETAALYGPGAVESVTTWTGILPEEVN